MPTKLEPLLLPQMVDAKKSKDSKEPETNSPRLSASGHTQNSSGSELSSPVTPTFSLRGQSRYSSSTSSVDSTFQSSAKAANSSPLIDSMDSFRIGKSALPDVKEEPLEREESFDMFDDSNELYEGLVGHCFPRASQDDDMRQSPVILPSTPQYDLTDDYFGIIEDGISPWIKQRRADDSALAGFTTRLNKRFPSLSRRWRGRKVSNASVAESSRDTAPSRTASSRASSVSRSLYDSSEKQDGLQPPTPPTSLPDDEDITSAAAVESELPGAEVTRDGLATTPLLPPLVVPESSSTMSSSFPKSTPVQSPLQSPAVADSSDAFSVVASPMGSVYTPQIAGLASPPLSTKPSISSMHQQISGHLVPSNEIPGIKLADPNDEWSYKLGHANFDIYPEPYLAESSDVEACKQMRANWETARCNYTKHLVRTGEHYGVTSKTYRLTQEKWSGIEAQWRKNYDLTISQTEDSGEDVATMREASAEPAALMEIPSINNARSEGKFPNLGDDEIVGPMVQAASLQPRPPKRKATFLKFLQDVKFPSSAMLGRLSGNQQSKPT
ncbi:MAG: hypothetical protein M1837_000843 [Sclerophora amabilis]|nr:MAG: hypothetical protein M1837_000843 [Sclerophora amabilis]